METERLLIRRFEPGDWRDMYEYLSSETVVRFEPYGVFTEEACRREAVRRAGDMAFWAVCLKNGGKLIGNVTLSKQRLNAWELGYVFNEGYHKKGYATEAAGALVDDVFTNRGARRVTAMCDPLNESSWKLLERLHFRREGHLRKNIYFKTGQNGEPLWVDTYEYAILSDEWAVRGSDAAAAEVSNEL